MGEKTASIGFTRQFVFCNTILRHMPIQIVRPCYANYNCVTHACKPKLGDIIFLALIQSLAK